MIFKKSPALLRIAIASALITNVVALKINKFFGKVSNNPKPVITVMVGTCYKRFVNTF